MIADRLPRARTWASLAVASLALAAPCLADEGADFFEKKIRPVLIERCYECHSAEAKKVKGDLLLDTRDGLLKGGESGPSLVPGKPDESLLIKAVRRLDKDLAMPPKKELPADQIEAFVEWVKMGAPDPRTGAVAAAEPLAKPATIDYAAARKNWAYRKPETPGVPEVKDRAWLRSPIDAFILARLEQKQLAPAPRAEPRVLIRRIAFDLTGLPPTPEEVAAFEQASLRDLQSAVAELVDRLLASPRYGERWARHWLDVVRYTDSFDSRVLDGDGRKMDCTEAWRYRDWVVNAFNSDLPYDQFITDQIAGDIVAAREFDPEKIVATGVYALGNWGGGDADKEKLLTDIADDQVDLTGRAFLGLTTACARCHDHKFDPISTEDYYGLAGIFFSTHILPDPGPKTNGPEMLRVSLLPPAEIARRDGLRQRLADLETQLAGGLRPLAEVKRDALGKPGLIGWSPKGADNPSATINTTGAEIAFLSIKLPARAVALHPGPKTPVTAAWRSPLAGQVRVSARLRDADPTCGDGVEWRLRKASATIGRGEIDNGKEAEFAEATVEVAEGELLRLVIKPRAEYTCDSTQVEFTVRAADGRVWDLREALIAAASNGQDGIWWICEGDAERLGGDAPDQAALDAERKQLAEELARPAPVAHALQEGGCPKSPHAGVHDVKVHVRGRYDRLGPLVPRRFPLLLAGDSQPAIAEGSGRLALARWLASPENPLTARVMANRVWQHHFGEGIVRTPNNFGKLGIPPTHPELLDWLALELVRGGWSLKALHRAIMLSATYQQASVPRPETARTDPENLLFGHMNRRRLESEAIRDNLLAVAGGLDETRGGPAERDFNKARRTLYIMTVRSDRATYQSLFDAADPTAIVEKRNDSTVAPQALFLLNHPFALAQMKALTERMQREAPADESARIAWLYQRLYARPPGADELRIAREALAAKADWEQYCHALLCANEFVYVD